MRGDVAEGRAGMKRLVLLGGGHAHVKVLERLAAANGPGHDAGPGRAAGWTVELISPYRRQIYSGMLPGWVAGHYPIEACAIDLDGLCRRAGVDFAVTAGIGLDLARREVVGADGIARPWDLLSIDTGPVAGQRLPGSLTQALSIRPIEHFIAAWPGLVERIRAASGPFELRLLGAGAGGVELAFAIRHRAEVEGWSGLRLSLIGSADLPLPGAPLRARQQIRHLLARRGIGWHG
ncbi:MAG: hypothetical protein RLZZ524_865, partial [Pseudomonadota bacterium]